MQTLKWNEVIYPIELKNQIRWLRMKKHANYVANKKFKDTYGIDLKSSQMLDNEIDNLIDASVLLYKLNSQEFNWKLELSDIIYILEQNTYLKEDLLTLA